MTQERKPPLLRREIPVGTYRPEWLSPNSRPIIVQIEVEIRDAKKGPELSICATATGPRGYYCGGQAVDEVRAVTDFRPGWDAAKRDKLIEVWERWHLNGIKAACEHQRARGETWTTHPNAKCPDCGYSLGSAWLYEALPDEVIEFVKAL